MLNDKVLEYLDIAKVQQYKSDIGFRTLVESVNDNMYIIPKYQRKYRWGKKQVIGLVESLLKGLPIPPIYTCRNDKNQLEILDGQQRVMSLFFYYIGYFLNKRMESAINFSDLDVGNLSFADALKEQFPLEELHITMKGTDNREINVDYASLPVEFRRRVDYTTITVIEIKIGREGKKNEILQTIFANLNKNGALLSNQEQRNGIFMCEFYDMLHDFNIKNIPCKEKYTAATITNSYTLGIPLAYNIKVPEHKIIRKNTTFLKDILSKYFCNSLVNISFNSKKTNIEKMKTTTDIFKYLCVIK